MNIKTIVKNIVDKYHTNNPWALAEIMGVIVQEDFTLKKTLGCSARILRHPVIVINGNKEDHIKRYVLAHELGHLVLHKDMNMNFLKANTLFSINKYEVQADTFAAELLLPDELIKDYKYLTIQQVARQEGLPLEVVKLKDISRVNIDQNFL